MLPEELVLLDNLSHLFNGFGRNHAKVYWSLINNVSKPVQQIEKETQLAHNTIYLTLNDLIQNGLVAHTNTTPKYYYCNPIFETVKEVIKQKRLKFKQEVNEAMNEIKKLVKNISNENIHEYLITIKDGKPILYNNKTKELLLWKHEIDEIKKELEKIPTKNKEKEWQIAIQQ